MGLLADDCIVADHHACAKQGASMDNYVMP
jgi:hypothetical protein